MSGLILTSPVSTPDLVSAISLACSPVFGTLDLANALGGPIAQSNAWRAVRTLSLAQLVEEAIARGVDLSEVKAACCSVPVVDTPPFHGAIGYDSRPRCPLCCRRHYVDKRDGSVLSCGDTQGFRNPPTWRWTRESAKAAVGHESHG